MNIIFLGKSGGPVFAKQFSSKLELICMLVTVIGLAAGLWYAGYWVGAARSPDLYVEAWDAELFEQRSELDQVRQEAQADMDALTRKLGELQAHVTRLDALGFKLVRMAKLDDAEFNFNAGPAVGGPEMSSDVISAALPSLHSALEDLSVKLEDRDRQLSVLEQLISTRNLDAEVFPSGRPVTRGWLSSDFGWRTSPFDGRRQFHKGIDFAGKAGSEILSVAGGVVTISGRRTGYGLMVEINHGNGYATRYAHNSKNLVREGETVKKGQSIAEMGTTGRSTGNHVHFEVLKNGRQINPIKFITGQS